MHGKFKNIKKMNINNFLKNCCFGKFGFIIVYKQQPETQQQQPLQLQQNKKRWLRSNDSSKYLRKMI